MPGDMKGLVDVDVVASEGASQHQVAIFVMFNEPHLGGPWRSTRAIARHGERLDSRTHTIEAQQRKVQLHIAPHRTSGQMPLPSCGHRREAWRRPERAWALAHRRE